MGQVTHWKLCQKFNIPCKDKWYDHDPEGVIENDQVKGLWDFRIQTDHQIEHNRADVVVLDKIERSCYVISRALLIQECWKKNKRKWKNTKN